MFMDKEERLTHFVVGQRVRVRQWDDMLEQYGGSHGGGINCQNVFVEGMKEYCGQELTIKHITNSGCVDFEEPVLFNWSLDMIEDIEEDVPEPEFSLGDCFMEAIIL